MYLYAITDQPELPVPAEPGLEGTSPFSLTYQDITAVVSPLTATERHPEPFDKLRTGFIEGVPPTEANLWCHEAVVEALMADRTVLPVRFGTVLADETAVEAVLATHYTDFVASLNRVRGRVELGLRVLWTSDFRLPIADCRSPNHKSKIENRKPVLSPPNVSMMGHIRPEASQIASGRAYMLARLEEERQRQMWRQRAETLAAELHTPLARLAAESTRQVLVTPRLLLTAAYLVERDRIAALRREVGSLSAAYPRLCFLCTGPWPPYSFVTATVPQETEDARL